jgi:hypothetical protein
VVLLRTGQGSCFQPASQPACPAGWLAGLQSVHPTPFHDSLSHSLTCLIRHGGVLLPAAHSQLGINTSCTHELG